MDSRSLKPSKIELKELLSNSWVKSARVQTY